MPVSTSAKKALRTATRRRQENLVDKAAYKKAIKSVKKAVAEGGKEVAALFSQAQSTLDRAAKSKTIHPNKAARLKSRLAKKMAFESAAAPAKAEKAAAKKAAAPKKTAAKKSE